MEEFAFDDSVLLYPNKESDLPHGCFFELHLTSQEDHCIDSELFTNKTLVYLTLSNGFYLEEGGCLPHGSVFFPALKKLSLIATGYGSDYMFDSLISGCPVLEELFIHYGDESHGRDWTVVVPGKSIKRLTISCYFSNEEIDRTSILFETPSLLYLWLCPETLYC